MQCSILVLKMLHWLKQPLHSICRLCSWQYSPGCNWPLLYGYKHISVQLVVQQAPSAIFCRMAFCGTPTLAVLLHRFIPLTLGHCKWLTTGYTSNHWPRSLRQGLWTLSSVNFPHSLQFCSVSYSTSMQLLAEKFMVAKECATLCGKEYNHFSLFSFITAAYLVMLFFSWHPLSCTCPCLLTFDNRS